MLGGNAREEECRRAMVEGRATCARMAEEATSSSHVREAPSDRESSESMCLQCESRIRHAKTRSFAYLVASHRLPHRVNNEATVKSIFYYASSISFYEKRRLERSKFATRRFGVSIIKARTLIRTFEINLIDFRIRRILKGTDFLRHRSSFVKLILKFVSNQ